MSARWTLGTGRARATSIAWLTVLALIAIGPATASGYTRLNLIAGGHADGGFAGDGGPAAYAWLDDPSAVATDAAGNVYVADSHNFRVRRISPGGEITTIAGNGRDGASRDGAPATATPLNVPVDLASDGRGNLYVLLAPRVGSGTQVVVIDSAGVLRVHAGTGTTGYAGDGGPAREALLDASSLAADGLGNVYIGERTRVRRVDPNGTITTIAGTGVQGFSGDGGPAIAAQLYWANALAVDRAGNLFIGTEDRIRKVDPAGTITTIAGTGVRGFSGDGIPATRAQVGIAGGLAVDEQGTLYVSDNGNRRIRTVDAAGIIRTIAGGGRPGQFGYWGPALRTRLDPPHGVAVDGQGLVYFIAGQSVFKLEPSLTPQAAGSCTRAAAIELLERSGAGNAGTLPDPTAQVLCGPFVGKGSKAMVISLRTPGCGVSIGWLVYRSVNGRWRRVFASRHGAFLQRVGATIRATQGVLKATDAHCFPSSWRARVWRWNGKRLVAGPWRKSKAPKFPTATAQVSAAVGTITATTGTDGDTGNDSIVIADGTGANRRVLTDGESSAISPDGTKVWVIDYEMEDLQTVTTTLKVLPVTGGGPTFSIPADGLSVAWSPDSTKLLATETGVSGEQRVLLIDATTGAQTELLKGNFAGASLSPDMTRLAYVELGRNADLRRGGDLNVLDLTTRAITRLRTRAAQPLWGPSAIAFAMRRRHGAQFSSDIATIGPDGTGFRRLTRVRRTRSFFGLDPLAWSSDGRRILTSVQGADGYWLNTYGVDAVRGGARLIARGVMPTAFSRDGRSIIGQNGDVSTAGFRYAQIVRVPWNGGKRRVLLRHAMFASFYG